MLINKIFIKTSAVAILALCFNQSKAQQIYKVSRYLDRSFLHNPAAVGANNATNIAAVYRSQWSGITGGPQTTILFGDTYFSKKNVGAGIVLYNDKTGAITRSGGELDLSYSIKLDGDAKRLMFGLGGEMIQYKIDKDKISGAIAGDPLLSSADTKTKADASFGMYYRSEKFNVGVSAKQLIGAKLGYLKNTATEGRLYRQYYLTSSYYYRTDEQNVLIPHAEVQLSENAPVNFQAGLVLEHNDIFSIGFGYDYQQSYTIFAGVKILHKLSINYAYDASKTPLSAYDDGAGSNEISLRYSFRK